MGRSSTARSRRCGSNEVSALIVGTLGAGDKHGATRTAIINMLAELGYQRVAHLLNERWLSALTDGHKRSNNTILVRDIAAAQQWVPVAPRFRVGRRDL